MRYGMVACVVVVGVLGGCAGATEPTVEAAADVRIEGPAELVLAVGDCGCDGGIFGAGYASCGRVADVIPVDAVVPGCPPTPLALMKGILAVVGRARVGAEATHAGRGSGRTALHDMDGPETVPSAGASAMPTAPAAAATGALPHSRPSVAWPPAPAGDATSSRP